MPDPIAAFDEADVKTVLADEHEQITPSQVWESYKKNEDLNIVYLFVDAKGQFVHCASNYNVDLRIHNMPFGIADGELVRGGGTFVSSKNGDQKFRKSISLKDLEDVYGKDIRIYILAP